MSTTEPALRPKFWGWGPEARQPPHDQVVQLASAAREQLGFGPAEVERPARVEDLELRPPRLEPPAALAPMCSTDPYERAAHAYGKAYRDIVRAFRGRIEDPPDVVAYPTSERRGAELLEWCAEASAAAIPY